MSELKSYGNWRSPITSEAIVSQSISLREICLDRDRIYWLEGRPQEGGRNVIVKHTADAIEDITPPGFNVRNRVHEYGGGAWTVVDDTIYFVNREDQCIYSHRQGKTPQPITPPASVSYADLIVDPDQNYLICVCEDYRTQPEPTNSLIRVDLNTGKIVTLAQGSDFYASPRLSPDGTRLAWISWNHPDLPWDQTRLWRANLQDEVLQQIELIAGQTNESIHEPRWSPDGILYWSSDRTNWWNLYRLSDTGIEEVYPLAAEFAYPHWVFGLSNYSFADKNTIICSYSQDGRWWLGKIDLKSDAFEFFDLPYTDIGSVHANSQQAVFIGGRPTQPTAIVAVNLGSTTATELKASSSLEIDSGYLSTPQAVAFPTTGDQTAYAWYYPPTNPDYHAPTVELPPLIVKSHGGPTAAASVNLNLKIQYWTSRGFAYLDVNYRGSTGYGRQYRQQLESSWGVVDVEDCINGAQYLVDRGWVDGDRLIITGSSAGGYTTLAALAFHNTFKAGASYYGISDLEILAKETHKFESRYFDRLIAPYSENQEIYKQRSPLHFPELLSCPIIFFQGLKDRVVPPNQAQMMFNSLKSRGIPVAYVEFAEEGHGFRSAETIQRAIDAELYFYARIFGLQPADSLPPIEIFNLDAAS